MKAQVLTAVLLMIALTTFAQSSRRDVSERRNNDKNNSRTEQRSTNQENSNNTRVEERKRTDQSSGSSARVDEKRNTNQQNSRVEERKNNERNYSSTNERRGSNDRNSGSRNDRRDWNRSTPVNRVVTKDRYDRHPRRVVVVDREHYTYRRPETRHVHITYRTPVRSQIIWSASLSRDYSIYYPEIRYWKYRTGYRIASVPAYNAFDYIGEVANIYGRVQDIYFEPEADEFYLYFGDFYPNQYFTVIIPGGIARQFDRNPFRFFQDQHIAVNGYVQVFGDRPEILVRSPRQIDIY